MKQWQQLFAILIERTTLLSYSFSLFNDEIFVHRLARGKYIRLSSVFEYIESAQGGSVIHREAAIYAASSPEFRNGIPVARNFALIGTHQRE